ncbi:FG-GAP-like repeat-containing protein [Reichenbachiella carrageenanivorans]|uniref:FG-GAP-like repeat-containing protein n=1 Tax=Reichenbachiella carrageenanivorans TaxID=2979869 RepID=A0ABY6D7I2_9BACT|nr:FG-GAP-like repeat-containing protein [Reichenbachiella carrageenanivorans]UXX79805.1 FG-GAP-like repeat-containing protein [Reichenbachiella carrageenanivorans]
MRRITHAILGMLFIVSCSPINEKQRTEQTLFTQLSSAHTGIEFRNQLTENDSLNYFTFPYIYMGGGVSTGDINNDGLVDIYFTGNQVENKLYLNKGDFQFEDITEKAGLSGDQRWVTGTTMADVNGDGFLDIYVSVSGKFNPTSNLLYLNNGDLTFTESAEQWGVADQGHTTQAVFFDFDHDNDLDLYVANYPPTPFDTRPAKYRYLMEQVTAKDTDRFYRNDGNSFTDITEAAGLMSYGLSLNVSVGDFDQNGWPDLYVSNDFHSPDYFYFNNADGTFSERSREVTNHTALYGMGTDAGDINNDGLLDLIQLDMTPKDNRRSKANMASMNPPLFWESVNSDLHYQYMQNAVQLNNGIGKDGLPVFSDIARLAGMALTDWSWSPLIADLDNDGWKDVFITNGTRRDINNKDYFAKIKNTWSADLSQRALELVAAMPSEKISNYVFQNKHDLSFSNASQAWGLDFFGYSNGSAVADLDNDGDLDLVVSNIDSVATIHKNLSREQNQNNYIQISLSGNAKNKFGLGSKIQIEIGDSIQYQELTLTRGFQSSSEPLVHFGLGDVEKIDKVSVTWPDGKSQTVKGVKANQRIVLFYKDSLVPAESSPKTETIFQDFTKASGIDFQHQENEFDDFQFETLLPHKMSNMGPGLAVGDINGDGLQDFFVGGASTFAGTAYIQKSDGTFEKSESQPWEADALQEDIGAVFFDADNDGDDDLYVVSGGSEFDDSDALYQDRLYINDGTGQMVKDEKALPMLTTSGSCVVPFDFDQDGDLDLFVGGRLLPRLYPKPAKSYLLLNESTESQVIFKDVTEHMAPELSSAGLVTSAVWTDFNNDQLIDLMVVGEWMPISFYENTGSSFENVTSAYGFDETVGWWFSIHPFDFDQDGDMDYVAGNLGLNYKYKASKEESFDVYLSDYDANGKQDIVLGYYQEGIQYPVRGRQCSSEQIPAIKKKFKSYDEFAIASLKDIYTTKGLENSLHYQAKTFASSYIENLGDGQFVIKALPNEAQISSVNGFVSGDYNGDGLTDLVMAGNLYASEIETTRNDAGIGVMLEGTADAEFSAIPMAVSGINLPYDVKALSEIQLVDGIGILVASNNGPLKLIKTQNK